MSQPSAPTSAGANPLPWFRIFPKEHIAATRSLTLAERGALFDLMSYAWMQGKLPKDPRRLAAMIGASPAEFRTIWPAVRPYFHAARGGGWTHPELEQLRAQSLEKRAVSKAKAQTAAAARWHPTAPDPRASGPRPVAELLPGLLPGGRR